MDPTTILIAQFVGPVILAVGIGVFFSRNYYVKIYRNLEQETLAVLMGGISILVAGIAMVMYHNKWDSFTSGLVSFIAWASIVKGIILISFPQMANKFGDMVADSRLFGFVSIFATACGAYLSYIAYLA